MKRDHARSLLEQGLAELANCREQKPVFDAICGHVAGYAHQILST